MDLDTYSVCSRSPIDVLPGALRALILRAETPYERVYAVVGLSEWLADVHPHAARSRARKSVEAASRLDDPVLLSRAHRAHARSLLFTVGPRASFQELTKAYAVSDAHDDTHGEAWCEYLIGYTLEYMGDTGGARLHVERAFSLFRTMQDLSGQSRVLNAFGHGEQMQGQYAKALVHHTHARDAALDAPDTFSQTCAEVFSAIARTHLGVHAARGGSTTLAQTRFADAIEELTAAHERSVRVGDRAHIPLTLAEQVLPLCWLRENDRAVAVAERALEAAGEVQLDHHLAVALRSAGMAYTACEEYDTAIEYLTRAEVLYQQWELCYDMIAVYKLLTEAYERSGNLVDALREQKKLLKEQLDLHDALYERSDRIALAHPEGGRVSSTLASMSKDVNLPALTHAHRRLEREFREMQRLAYTDGLTGLANRREADERLTRYLIEAQLRHSPVSAILIDIDHFKPINDTYSHAVGDKVLQAVAAQLDAHARAQDRACRIGGEEFVVLLPHTAQHDAVIVAERLRHAVEALDVSDIVPNLRVTISCGVADALGGQPSALLEAADKALYDAKTSGRNRVSSAG